MKLLGVKWCLLGIMILGFQTSCKSRSKSATAKKAILTDRQYSHFMYTFPSEVPLEQKVVCYSVCKRNFDEGVGSCQFEGKIPASKVYDKGLLAVIDSENDISLAVSDSPTSNPYFNHNEDLSSSFAMLAREIRVSNEGKNETSCHSEVVLTGDLSGQNPGDGDLDISGKVESPVENSSTSALGLTSDKICYNRVFSQNNGLPTQFEFMGQFHVKFRSGKTGWTNIIRVTPSSNGKINPVKLDLNGDGEANTFMANHYRGEWSWREGNDDGDNVSPVARHFKCNGTYSVIRPMPMN